MQLQTMPYKFTETFRPDDSKSGSSSNLPSTIATHPNLTLFRDTSYTLSGVDGREEWAATAMILVQTTWQGKIQQGKNVREKNKKSKLETVSSKKFFREHEKRETLFFLPRGSRMIRLTAANPKEKGKEKKESLELLCKYQASAHTKREQTWYLSRFYLGCDALLRLIQPVKKLVSQLS